MAEPKSVQGTMPDSVLLEQPAAHLRPLAITAPVLKWQKTKKTRHSNGKAGFFISGLGTRL